MTAERYSRIFLIGQLTFHCWNNSTIIGIGNVMDEDTLIGRMSYGNSSCRLLGCQLSGPIVMEPTRNEQVKLSLHPTNRFTS